eukprot:11223082-Lingulodinium_polyedra.AAC.1
MFGAYMEISNPHRKKCRTTNTVHLRTVGAGMKNDIPHKGKCKTTYGKLNILGAKNGNAQPAQE